MRILHRPYLNCLSEKISGSRNHEAHEDHEDGSCHEDVCRWSTKITKKAADGSTWGPALRPFGIFVIFVTFYVSDRCQAPVDHACGRLWTARAVRGPPGRAQG